MHERPICVLLKRTEQLATEKKLVEHGEKLYCEYAHICNGLTCLLVDNLQTRYFPLDQECQTQKPNSRIDKFYHRLEQYFFSRNKSIT